MIPTEHFDFNDGNGPVPAHRHINPDGTKGGWVAKTAKVSESATVSENALVGGDARVTGSAMVTGAARVSGSAEVSGGAKVSGFATVTGGARVGQTSDYLVIGPLGSRDAYLTVTFKDKPRITTGCFTGTIKEFETAVKKKHGENQFGKKYLETIAFIETLIKKSL